jgi:hypothetical protein
MGVPAIGAKGQMGIGASLPVTTRFEFTDENIQCIRTNLETEGIRGSRSRIADNMVPGTRAVDGSFKTKPFPASCRLSCPTSWVLLAPRAPLAPSTR